MCRDAARSAKKPPAAMRQKRSRELSASCGAVRSRKVSTLRSAVSTQVETEVPVEKRRRSPYGTHICRNVRPCGSLRDRWSCPPLFLGQREGFWEHAVGLNQLTHEVVGRWLAVT